MEDIMKDVIAHETKQESIERIYKQIGMVKASLKENEPLRLRLIDEIFVARTKFLQLELKLQPRRDNLEGETCLREDMSDLFYALDHLRHLEARYESLIHQDSHNETRLDLYHFQLGFINR